MTPLFRYRDFDKRVAFVNAELEKIRAIPGVVNAGAISRIPLTVNDQATFYLLAGQSERRCPRTGRALARRDARLLRDDRRAPARRPVLRHLRPAVGIAGGDRQRVLRRIATSRDVRRSARDSSSDDLGEKGYWYTIVGVVKEIRERGVAEELRPAIYRVHEQADQTGDQPSGIVVRTAVEPASIVPAVRQAIWSVDKNQPIARVQTIEDIVARQLSAPSQNTALLGAFALLALLLASLGLYGVLSYAVTQRTNEIGVRMALGATSSDILLSFGRRGLALTLAGLAIGLVLAVIAARLMTTLFYGFRPDYVPAVAAVSLVLLARGRARVFCSRAPRLAHRSDGRPAA